MFQDFGELKTKAIQLWEGADIKVKCTHTSISNESTLLESVGIGMKKFEFDNVLHLIPNFTYSMKTTLQKFSPILISY